LYYFELFRYKKIGTKNVLKKQGCGSGFSDFVDPDPYWESGSRIQGQENEEISVKKCTFELFFLNLTTKKV
jgi:hypothetical protein